MRFAGGHRSSVDSLQVAHTRKVTKYTERAMHRAVDLLNQHACNISWHELDTTVYSPSFINVYGCSLMASSKTKALPRGRDVLALLKKVFGRDVPIQCPNMKFVRQEHADHRSLMLKRFVLSLDEKGFYSDPLGLCGDASLPAEKRGLHANCGSYVQRPFLFETYPWPRLPTCDALYLGEDRNDQKQGHDDEDSLGGGQPPHVRLQASPSILLDKEQRIATLACMGKGRTNMRQEGKMTVSFVEDPIVNWCIGVRQVLTGIANSSLIGRATTLKEIEGVALWPRTKYGQKLSRGPLDMMPGDLVELLQAFAYDTACNRQYDGAEAFKSQIYNMHVQDGEVDILYPLEEVRARLREKGMLSSDSSILPLLNRREQHSFDTSFLSQPGVDHRCVPDSVVLQNVDSLGTGFQEAVASRGVSGTWLPTITMMVETLMSNPEVLVVLCSVYAQDYICLGLPVPQPCVSMLANP
mmetsp:Transcript_4358/g.15639  ORF Transcript_4358/g.15639 Transcript_4358/m.15639 type:complete len:468 (-) Transcript_4358:93-1496(-)|eukprot:scaffold1594_cov401-Prasinococcus_capsulatus_cf.AAC.5